jgi:hypothetical protein
MRKLKLNGKGSLIFLLLAYSCFSCVQRKNVQVPSVESKTDSARLSEYPDDIVNRKIEKQYDLVKWTLFCVYCDNTVNFNSSTGIKTAVTFGSLDLKYAGLYHSGDTLEIYFDFYFQDTIKCVGSILDNPPIATGGGFLDGSERINYFTSSSTMARFWKNDPSSRFNNPFQNDVVEYLNRNKGAVDRWFFREAQKRGIVD